VNSNEIVVLYLWYDIVVLYNYCRNIFYSYILHRVFNFIFTASQSKGVVLGQARLRIVINTDICFSIKIDALKNTTLLNLQVPVSLLTSLCLKMFVIEKLWFNNKQLSDRPLRASKLGTRGYSLLRLEIYFNKLCVHKI